MKDALSPAALAELVEATRGRVLLAFDLDGTLAPIAARPDDARVPDDLQHMLAVLAVRIPVAIVTGRAVRDARRMLWFSPRYVVGNHGAEGVPGQEAAATAYAARCRDWLARIRASDACDSLPGLLIEDKTFSLSLHYRLTRDPEAARRTLLALAQELSPAPRLVSGKRVLNLVPAEAPHKGEALRALIAHARAERALYVGDDVTDEDVFELRLPGVHTVRVEPEGESAADYRLRRQEDVGALLRELSRSLSHPPARSSGRMP